MPLRPGASEASLTGGARRADSLSGAPRPGPLRQLAAVQAALMPVFAFRAATGWSGTTELSRRGLLSDWLLFTLAGCVLLCWQRRLAPAVAVLAGELGLLYAVVHAKRAIVQDWPRWSDLALLPEVFSALPGPVAGAVLLWGLGLVILAANLRLPEVPGRIAGALLVASLTLPLILPARTRDAVDRVFRWYPWVGNDPAARGLILALARDAAETRLEWASLEGLAPLPLPARVANPRVERRNLHVILAESLTDPRDLGPDFPRASLDPRLNAWAGGRALSPGLRGGSSASEFELLCGLPATARLPDTVVFNGLGGRAAPCLPAELAALGYHTRASAPLEPWFYNARRSYRSLGFQEALFAPDLPEAARRDAPNPTRALMRHNRRWLETRLASGGPLFNHLVTVKPHHPFRGPFAEPPVEAASPRATRLATGLRDASRAIADHVSWLRERDPDAVILVVGDHQAPGFGPPAATPAASLRQRGVPVALLDAGVPRSVGLVAHFQITERIRAALAGTAPPAREGWLRPVRGGGLLFPLRSGGVGVCPSADSRCPRLEAHVAALESRTRRLVAMTR